MKKEVLKEFKKEYLWIKILFYGLFTLVGFELLHFSDLGFTNPIKYVPVIFFVFAFLSLFAYFSNRIKGNYELLYFGLINVITGTFVLINRIYPDSGFILADAVLLYAILNVLNSCYTCIRLFKNKDVSVFMKIAVTFMLLFLGVFVISALYDKVEFGTLILGYYFSAFGLLSLLEIFTTIIVSNKSYQKRILNYLTIEEPKEEKKETKNEIPKVKEEKLKAKKASVEVKKEKNSKKVVKNRTIKKIKRK
jgi:hypothetical protein